MDLDYLIEQKVETLIKLGFSEREQADLDLEIHINSPDDRYPRLCVNGDLNFSIDIDPETGELYGDRECICAARSDHSCICDL